MPVPLVPILIGVAISLLAAAAIWNWDEIRSFLHGKEFAVLGPRQVGKTTLLQFLRTGEISKSYRPTLAPDEFAISHRVVGGMGNHGNKEIRITMREGMDVSGQKAAYASWRRVTKTADVVLYLFRADLVMADDEKHLARIRDDIGQIGKWVDDRDDKPQVYLFGTHCDLSSDFESKESDDAVEYYLDAFGSKPAIKHALRRSGADAVILGSLKDAGRARGSLIQLFQHLDDASKNS